MYQTEGSTRQDFQALCADLQTRQVPPEMAIKAFQAVFGNPESAQLFEPLANPAVSVNLLDDASAAKLLESPTGEMSSKQANPDRCHRNEKWLT